MRGLKSSQWHYHRLYLSRSLPRQVHHPFQLLSLLISHEVHQILRDNPGLARSLHYKIPKDQTALFHLPHIIISTSQTTMHLAPLLVSLAAISAAAPWSLFDDAHDFSDELSEFYGKVSKYIKDARHNVTPNGQCDPSKISLPSYASGLPSPDGVKPMYVALGRGTQVYTHLPSRKDAQLIHSTELHLCRLHIQLRATISWRACQSLQCHLRCCKLPRTPPDASWNCIQNRSPHQSICGFPSGQFSADGPSFLL